MSDEAGEYRQLTAADLAERWKPLPLAEREITRSRYLGPDGAVLVVEHPQAIPPPVITLYSDNLGGELPFRYDGMVE